MTLTGKGYYIWIVRYCEDGDPDRIAALAKEANLSHVLVKIADGSFPYNIDLDNGYDYARPVIKKLQSLNISVWGWQYIYGDYPDQEAEIAVSRALNLGVNGFVVNAEKEYEDKSKAAAASRYMNILRSNLGSMPIALSSYRYPSYHIHFPWENFLERCDYNMPQIYWIQSHNKAGDQLMRSVNEFKTIRPFRPIIPTGPTFKQDGWVPTQDDVVEFMNVAKQLNLTAVNFWYWEGCRKYMPNYWELVRDYQYDTTPHQASLPQSYIGALNSRNASSIASLYEDNAVLIRSDSASQGKAAIQSRIASLIGSSSNGHFSLISETQNKNIYSFQWMCTSPTGPVIEGKDTLGVKNSKISYHYSFSKPVSA